MIVTEIVDGGKVTHHLCKECAEKVAMAIPEKKEKKPTKATRKKQRSKLTPSMEENLVCSGCGLTYNEFRNILRFGCEHCYDSFKDTLIPLLEDIHGSSKYKGQVPFRDKEKVQLLKIKRELERKLREAVKAERFEEAAHLRDELKELEEKLR